MKKNDNQLLSASQAARLLGKSYHWLHYYVKLKKTPEPVMVAGRAHFKPSEIIAWYSLSFPHNKPTKENL